jgi:hypothetical protein
MRSEKAAESRRNRSTSVELVEEAARLICEEGYADYRLAKHKAAERLGLSRRAALPDNVRIEAAVIERQNLFGGAQFRARLLEMRRTALRAMRLLDAFDPRLSGSSVSGAIGEGHRVQLHLVADQPESVEMLLHDRHIPFEQDERRYRLADGRDANVPLLRFQADRVGVDLAVFDAGSLRHPPLSQIDGKPARRLTPEQLRALLGSDAV